MHLKAEIEHVFTLHNIFEHIDVIQIHSKCYRGSIIAKCKTVKKKSSVLKYCRDIILFECSKVHLTFPANLA